ncbi:MAG: DUF1127 domain-containing protein [Pseudodonghicola sp.]
MSLIAAPTRRRAHRCARRASALSQLGHMIAVWRQRRVLKALDDRALDDIGLTRDEAETEAGRRFWDAPESWRR